MTRKREVSQELKGLQIYEHLGKLTALVRLYKFESGSQGTMLHISDTLMVVHSVKHCVPAATGACTSREFKTVVNNVIELHGYRFVVDSREDDRPAFTLSLSSDHPVLDKLGPGIGDVLVRYEGYNYLVSVRVANEVQRILHSAAKPVSADAINGV